MGGQCVASLPLPSWFPAAVALLIAVVSCIIIFIAYCIRERRLRKTFYGITDEMEEEEKQQEEADALGKFDGEVKVIQSMEPLDPHSIAPTPGSQVKVLMKRRHRPAGSTKPPSTSREQCCYTPAVTPAISPELEREIKYTIDCNQNGLADQVIDTIKFMVAKEFYGRGIPNPKQKQLGSEEEIRIGEAIVSELRAKLENLTNNNPWICHGRLMNSTNWVVNGHENLLSAHSDLTLSVKITIEQPISIVLIGYSLKHIGSSGSCLTPVQKIITSKDKLHSSAPLDSTLHPTDPLTPTKDSKASLLKKCKTAEPINHPSRTPVTKIITAPTTAATAPSNAMVLSPGRPGTTVVPRKSETKKPPAASAIPVGLTPKLPPTPRRTPPNQTPAPTPTPAITAATQTPNTVATTPGQRLAAAAVGATPKAHTPVVAKTITGISPTPLTTATTQIATTPMITKTGSSPNPITTQIGTPAPTVTKTPSAGTAAAGKHGKNNRSDDTQVSGK